MFVDQVGAGCDAFSLYVDSKNDAIAGLGLCQSAEQSRENPVSMCNTPNARVHPCVAQSGRGGVATDIETLQRADLEQAGP